MNIGRLVFAQIMDMLDPKQLTRCIDRYPMPRASKGMTARDQFLAMAFAQITFRESLRDIEACLRAPLKKADFGPIVDGLHFFRVLVA